MELRHQPFIIMKEKVKFLKYLFTLVLIIISCTRPEPEPIVARAGKTTIPLPEFRDRYEFTPHILMTKDVQRNRKQVLISLLGEKILAEEAYHRKLTENEKFKTYSAEMEKEALVEALFEKEVASKIQISDEDVKQAFMLSQSELEVQVLSFDSMEQARKAKKQIDAGKNLHQVKREFQTDSFISADSVLTLTVKWGQSHPEIEQVAFQLQPDQVSDPVDADGISFIIKLMNKRTNVLVTEADYLREAPSIRKKIKERKRAEMFTDFMRSLMADKQVKVSHEIFNFVASELEKFYPIEDSSTTPENIQRSMELSLDSLKSESLADHLNDTFARFNDGSIWTVADFIKKLSVSPFRLSYKSRKSFRNSLSHAIRRMIEFESLARKGREAGLQRSNYVHYQKKMWDDAYLAQQLRQQISDTVTISEAEMRSFYDLHNNNYLGPEIVNLQEILVDDEALAHQIFQRMKSGEDISKLAQKYNKREISLKSNGVMGYFSTAALGKIGEAARKLKIGEMAGPVKTEKNRFSIFKILDKKEAGPLPYEQVREGVKRDALTDKRMRAIDQFLVRLADKYEIKINQAVLDTITTTEIGMMVLKQHFPNRMAAPLVVPLNQSHKWQNLFLNNIK